MKVLFCLMYLSLLAQFTYSNAVNNVRLVNHIDYMINVLQEVVTEVEHREWCSLKLPNISTFINETVIDRHYLGTVTYSQGFLASLQQVDILRAGVDQIWSWNNTDSTGSVNVTATLRMTDLTVGYNVVADLQDGQHWYTVTVTYPLVQFMFIIRKNMNTEVMTTEVTARVIDTATMDRIKFLPMDDTTDVLATLFNVQTPEEGIRNWGEQVFAPIALNVVTTKIDFPAVCFDCPV